MKWRNSLSGSIQSIKEDSLSLHWPKGAQLQFSLIFWETIIHALTSLSLVECHCVKEAGGDSEQTFCMAREWVECTRCIWWIRTVASDHAWQNEQPKSEGHVQKPAGKRGSMEVDSVSSSLQSVEPRIIHTCKPGSESSYRTKKY